MGWLLSCLLGVVLFHVVEYILDILVLLKLLKKLVELHALLGSHLLEVVGDALKLGADDFVAALLEILLDVGKLLKCAVEYDFLFIGLNFVDTVVDEFKFKILDRNTVLGLDLEHALVLEEE